MHNRPADDAHRSGRDDGRANGAEPGPWLQRAGSSVFFDVQLTEPGGAGELRRRTRLYHEENGTEATLPRLGTDRLGELDPRPARVSAAAVLNWPVRLPRWYRWRLSTCVGSGTRHQARAMALCQWS